MTSKTNDSNHQNDPEDARTSNSEVSSSELSSLTNDDTDPSILASNNLSGDTDIDRDPFEELASEFSERYRNGEMPSVEEYAERHPELAAEIRDLFPTIAAMEQLKDRKAPSKPAVGGLELEQLGDFRILGEIGRGGMGVVYEAEQVSLGRHVAVKVLPKQALLDERHLRRFEREAQTAAKLHHTNIVPVFGVGQQDGYHYIVMQFIPGVGLDEILMSLRSLVLEDDSPQYRVDSSSRASHANHNAQALLDGNFSKHVTSNFASSFTKDTKQSFSTATPKGGTGSLGGTAATMEIPSAGTTPTAMFSGSSALAAEPSQSLGDSVAGSGSSDSPARVKTLSEDTSKVLGTLDREYYRSVAKIGQQVADALAYAHEQGTLHRDIKPGNLLLDGTGTVWVADFGLAKLAEQDNVSRTGDLVGTLSYMPPESFSGDTDSRGDVYALGLTLFEMLALRPAYYGRDRGKLVKQITEGELPRLSKLNPAIPRDLETIVLKSVAHRPEDRYTTAREMEEDLESYLNDMPIKARRMSLPEQFTRWCRKNKVVASLSAAVLTLLLVSSATFGLLYQKAESARKQVEIEKANVVAEKDRAKNEEREAQRQKRIAKNTAREAIDALLVLFDGMFPDRLPPTADQSIAGTSEDDSDESTTTGTSSSTEEESTATVTAAPVTPEMAGRFELLIKSFNKLAKRAGSDEFANVFADLSIRVGKLHKQLGNRDEAQVNFQDGIDKYKKIVKSGETLTVSSVVGLASSYNEMGDLLNTARNREAKDWFRKAHNLFDDHRDLLADSSRARYEEARTYFLQANEYRRGPGFGGPWRGRGGPGRGRGGGRGNGRSRREWRDGRDRGARGDDGGERKPPGDDGRGPQPRPPWDNDGPPPANGPEGERPPGPPGQENRPGDFEPRRGGPGPKLVEMFGQRMAEARRRYEEEKRLRADKLEKAVGLLEPIVVDEDEANPEFRYLLARCHAGIAKIASREDDKSQRRESVGEAVRLLSKLVGDYPNVPDYKYEFAIHSLEDHGASLAERLARTRKAVTFSKEISTKNSAVVDYAKLYVRALEEKAKTLLFLSNESRGKRTLEERMELIVEAKKTLEILEERQADAESRFPEVNYRFSSVSRWKQLADLQKGKLLSQQGEKVEASAILQPFKDRMVKEVKREIKNPNPMALFKLGEQATALCEIEMHLKGKQAAIKLCDQLIKHRRTEMDDVRKSMSAKAAINDEELEAFRQLESWGLQVHIRARVLGAIGETEKRRSELSEVKAAVEEFLRDRDGRPGQLHEQLARDLLVEVQNQLDGKTELSRQRRGGIFGRGRFSGR